MPATVPPVFLPFPVSTSFVKIFSLFMALLTYLPMSPSSAVLPPLTVRDVPFPGV